jgi:outer membrane lipoprotein-sorting protein
MGGAEDHMLKGKPAALAGAVLAALTVVAAAAEAVPVPRPGPQRKLDITPPRLTAEAVKPQTPLSLAPTDQPLPNPVPTTGRSPMAAVAQFGRAVAFDAGQRALVEKANGYLTAVRTLIGDFVQVGANGNRAEGKFYLAKPGRVRFEYSPPSVLELVADGQSVVVRDTRLATQDLYPLSQTPLRFLLADRIDLLKDTNVIAVYSDDLFVTVVIEEKQVIAGTHRLMLMFGAKDFQLKQWTVTDPQGYDTTVAIYNLDATQKLDPSLFKISYERILQ